MAPVFATKMGLAFDGNDLISRSQTPAAGRDRQGLSKAERLLGVSDAAGQPFNGTPEWRPRQRKLRNIGSNLSLLTDLKKVISGSSPRSSSRPGRSPILPTPLPPRRGAQGLHVQTDQRSIRSDIGLSDRSPLSAGRLIGHHKQASGSLDDADIPRVPELPAQDKLKMGKYTRAEQDKIIDNLAMNGMMSEKRKRDKRPRSTKDTDDTRTGQGHSRGNSGASKGSNAASSRYSQDQQGHRYSESRKGSTSSAVQPPEDPARHHPARRSSQILSPRMEYAPGIRISRIDSPEGERIRTWLTYTDASSETAPGSRPGFLGPGKLGTVQESQSSTSVHTMQSVETGSFFPIQGGPDDWSTIHRHSRQSSILVKAEPTGEGQSKAPGCKGSKVFYTDLQVESVLALSSSDSDSDAESEASALARKRLSLVSTGNETQPTAWSSTASSRSQSRKMSLNTRATSPNRFSFSSDQWNHPMPNAQLASAKLTQPSPMRQDADEMDLSEYPPSLEEDITSPTHQGPPSPPTLTPGPYTDPQLNRMALIAQEETPNPLLEAVRVEGRARKSSTASTASQSRSLALATTSDLSTAPTRPLPMPPVQSPFSTPTIQTPSEDDASSVFSFPKPPRVLNKTRNRSTDLLSSPVESIPPGFDQSATPESTESDGSNETIKATPSVKRRPSNLSMATVNETSPQNLSPQSPEANGLLSPAAAYRGGAPIHDEKFSPIVLAFPDHIKQQMDDMSEPPPTPPPEAFPDIQELDANVATGIAKSSDKPTPLPIPSEPSHEPSYEPHSQPYPLHLAIPARSSSINSSSSPFISPSSHSGSRSAPLPIKTDLSPVAEQQTSPHAVHTAPPSVQNHWEKALAANFPAIPLPQAPSRPLRRFHLPSNSTASTMTTGTNRGTGGQSPRLGERDFEARFSVGPRARTPSVARAATPVRSGTPVGFRTRVMRSSSDLSMGGPGSRSSTPTTPRNSDGSANSSRGMRTSKRISTGKGIEPLRLSRIGNAV